MNGAQILAPESEAQQAEDPLHGVAFLVPQEHDDQRVAGRDPARVLSGAANELMRQQELGGGVNRPFDRPLQDLFVEVHLGVPGRDVAERAQDPESHDAVGFSSRRF